MPYILKSAGTRPINNHFHVFAPLPEPRCSTVLSEGPRQTGNMARGVSAAFVL